MDVNRVMDSLRAQRASGDAVIVAGVGSGLTAKGAITGGADLIAVYNTAIYRVAGLPTALAFLPYDDANALTLRVLPEVMAVAGRVPVLAGLGAHDPRTGLDSLLDGAMAAGAAGVTNEPFLGLYGSEIAAQLNAAGLGFSREVLLLERAVERGMIGLGWAFTPHEAQSLAAAGVQIVGAMVGVTAGGSAGGMAGLPLDDACHRIEAMVRVARAERDDIMVLGHGGPLTDAGAVNTMLESTGADGYVTGSTGERMPVVAAVSDAVSAFKRAGPHRSRNMSTKP